MQTLAELEQRITAALERIGKGLELAPPSQPAPPPASASASAEVAALEDALRKERAVSARLTAELGDRARPGKDRDAAAPDPRIERMTLQLDVQGLELQRMRKMVIQLREQLRLLSDTKAQTLSDPALVNRAMLGELEALRATRQSEVAEMDEILAALGPLLHKEGAHA